MKRKPLTLLLLATFLAAVFWVGNAPSSNALNELSTVQWSQTYGDANLTEVAKCVVQSSDGGYVLAGSKQTVENQTLCWLIKTDAYGNMIWNKTLGEPNYGGAQWLIKTSDGGYALAGAQSISYPNNVNTWLIKTDSVGEMQWSRVYTNGALDFYTQCLIQTNDGGFALASKGLLIKTDSAGNVVWSRSYPGILRVLEDSGNKYTLLGVTTSSNSHPWLAQTNSTGYLQWNKTYLSDLVAYPNAIVCASDGGYAFAGQQRYSRNGFSNIFLLKTDGGGNLLWGKTWGEPYADDAESIVQTSDGGYAMACYTSHADFVLLKTNSDGTQSWAKKYVIDPNATLRVASPFAIIETSDGGYILAGHSGDDAWLVKTDAAGNNPTGSDIIVPTVDSFVPSISPTATQKPETQTPKPSAMPTSQKPTDAPTPTVTPSVDNNLQTGLAVIVIITIFVVIGTSLLVYRRHKRQPIQPA